MFTLPASICRLVLALATAGVLSASALAASADDSALSRDDALWLERLTFGLDSATIARFDKLGRRRFLDEQLSGRDDTLPPDIAREVAAMPISTTDLRDLMRDLSGDRRRVQAMPDGDEKNEARKALRQRGDEIRQEASAREVLRAVYSPAQLKEQMVWFWLNHFSVFADKAQVRFFVADYADTAIRPHALGKFKDLVMATLTHPAMLVYLDNAQNAKDHVNENYARELMELHTLGVDAGYTQADVEALAHVLTGVGLDRRAIDRAARAPKSPLYRSSGLFAFVPDRHDFGPKTILGYPIAQRGFGEVEEAVDLLVRQPACARFVSKKIATYFVADDPPPELVAKMAEKFRGTDGDIAAVLRTMFESPQFEASLGRKFKDPMQYLVSALRLTFDGRMLPNPKPAVGGLRALGEPLFGHPTPDGFPMVASAWSSSGQLTARFDLAKTIADRSSRLLREQDGTPVYDTAIGPYLSDSTKETLAKAGTARERHAYLLASPEFNYR